MGIFDRKPNVKNLERKRDVKGLIKALQYKKDPEIRARAVELLGKLRDTTAVEPLIQALKDEDGYYARGSMVRALRDLEDTRAIRPLTQALKDNNANVWMLAAEALVRMGWKPSNEFEQIPYLIVAQKWDNLVKVGEPAYKRLYQAVEFVSSGTNSCLPTNFVSPDAQKKMKTTFELIHSLRVEKRKKLAHQVVIKEFNKKFPEIVEFLSKMSLVSEKEWNLALRSNPNIGLKYAHRNVKLKDLSWKEGNKEEIIEILAFCGRFPWPRTYLEEWESIHCEAEEAELILASDLGHTIPVSVISVTSKKTECHDGPEEWHSWIAGMLYVRRISENTYSYFFDGGWIPANFEQYFTYTIPKHPFDTDR